VKLYEWCLDKFAKVGDKILDTHLGSQSSRIAAYKLGFDFWGYEIDHDYFEQGNQRFEKESRLICHNDNLF
jgi:site-specific DNA-methyltransferase (adenine-specific)